MKAALCLTKDSVRGRYILECFAQGLSNNGDRFEWIESRFVKHKCSQRGVEEICQLVSSCDVVVQICTANKHHRNIESGWFRHAVEDAACLAGIRRIVIDSGFLSNQREAESGHSGFCVARPETFRKHDGRIYYQVGYDGLKRNAQYYNKDSPPDRWQKLNRSLRKQKQNGSVLMIGQPITGASVEHSNILEWYRRTANELRGEFVVFRPHPSVMKNKRIREQEKRWLFGTVFKDSKNWCYRFRSDIESEFEEARIIAVFSSNASVEASVDGLSVYGCDPICMAWPIRSKKSDGFAIPDRTQWACDLAYAQWNCSEMRSGECWSHLRPHYRVVQGQYD